MKILVSRAAAEVQHNAFFPALTTMNVQLCSNARCDFGRQLCRRCALPLQGDEERRKGEAREREKERHTMHARTQRAREREREQLRRATVDRSINIEGKRSKILHSFPIRQRAGGDERRTTADSKPLPRARQTSRAGTAEWRAC